MAEQMKLVRTYDFEADQHAISLLSNTDGFETAYGGWIPEVAPANRKTFVSEVITLRVQGTSTDTIAASLQKLADKAEEAQRFQVSGARDYAVWFRVQFSGEGKGRQTLVQELRHEPASSIYDVSLRSSFHWNRYILGIDRAPWWEGTACGTITGGTINCIGGTFAYGTVKGDIPGRIAQLRLSNVSGSGLIFPYGRAWVGYKSNRYGTVTSFVPYWGFGTAATGTTEGTITAAADAAAKSGTSLTFNPATGTAYFAYGMALRAVTSTPLVMRGDYLVLLRARMAGTAQYLMQMKTGWLDDYVQGWLPSGEPDDSINTWPNAKSYPRVSIYSDDNYIQYGGGTTYHFYEMGRISIPPYQAIRSQLDLHDFSILFFGEKVSGTSLHMDGIVLIPMDGFVQSFVGGSATRTSDIYSQLVAVNGPDGRQEAFVQGSINYIAGTSTTSAVAVNTPVFSGGLDAGYNGVVVLAAEKFTGSLTSQALTVETKYFERWKEIRGSD